MTEDFMNELKKLLLTSFLFASQLSYGGGWTSGGGELIRDAHNPWFLSNTKEVSYCIQINEKEFGQNKEFVRLRIQKAIQFWKTQLTELTYHSPFYQMGFNFHLGTQNFTEVSCEHSHDLAFQFANLTKEQTERMGDLSKTVAVTVRTEYDKVNLRGKGFIYFNKNNQFEGMPWTRTEGSRLLLVMIHELGHLFGIQHDENVQFMKADYAETLLDPKQFQWTDSSSEFLNRDDRLAQVHLFTYHPFSIFEQIGMCASDGINLPMPKPEPIHWVADQRSTYQKFFGIKTNAKCEISYIKNNKFQLFSGETMQDLHGEANLEQQDLNSGFFHRDGLEIVNFWIPPEQKVFEYGNKGDDKINIATFYPKQFFKGTYRSVDGQLNRAVAFEVWNSGSIYKITGYMDQKIYMDLQFDF